MDKVYFGEVIFFDVKKGYGFISWSMNNVPQTDMFIHYSGINCEGFKTLTKGQQVSFSLGTNHKNQPKAVNVTII